MIAASPAPIIAAVAAAARRRVVRAFTDAEAFSPETAVPFTPQRHLDRKFFRRLVDFGALIEAGDELYYVDRDRLREYDSRRRRRAGWILGGVLAATAAALGLTQL